MRRKPPPRPLRTSFQGDVAVAAKWRHWAETQARRKQRVWRDGARGVIKITAPDLGTESVDIQLRRIYPGFDQLIIRGRSGARYFPIWMYDYYNSLYKFDIKNIQRPERLVFRPPEDYALNYLWCVTDDGKILRSEFDRDTHDLRIFENETGSVKYTLHPGTSDLIQLRDIYVYRDKLYAIVASFDDPIRFGTWFSHEGAQSSVVRVYDLETGEYTGKEYDCMSIDGDSLYVGRHGILARGWRENEPYFSNNLYQRAMVHAEFDDTHCKIMREVGVNYMDVTQSGDYIFCCGADTVGEGGSLDWDYGREYVFSYKRNEDTGVFELHKRQLVSYWPYPVPNKYNEESVLTLASDFAGGFFAIYQRLGKTGPADAYNMLVLEATLRHYVLRFDEDGDGDAFWEHNPAEDYDLIQNIPASVPHTHFTYFRVPADKYPPTGPVPDDWEDDEDDA